MGDWVGLLAGSVLCGAAAVAALALPRSSSPIAALAGMGALFSAVSSFGSIATRYDTGQAIGVAVVVFIAGMTAGYAIAASSLTYLQHRARPAHFGPDGGDLDGIVLVACCDPERYDPGAVARRQDLLAASAEIEVPTSALPFLFLAEKARYRALGGRSPGPAVARHLATRLAESRTGAPTPLELAWCHAPDSLATAVARCHAAGARRVAIVPLGMPTSAPFDAALAHLGDATRDANGPAVRVAPTVWNDRALPERLAERVVAATAGLDLASVGVALVGEGVPPAWERRYGEAAEAETYFNQRVRALLDDAGIREPRVRVCWIDWQAPDVTESVRHLAALGCTRVVVAPATIALPTLTTSLDLGHALALARVPHDVQVVTLQPWGDDEGFAEAIERCATAALTELRRAQDEA